LIFVLLLQVLLLKALLCSGLSSLPSTA